MTTKNPVIHSYFVSGGPQVHRSSGLLSAGLGSYPHEIQEVALPSSWIFNRSENNSPLLRFSVTFPEEWASLCQQFEMQNPNPSFAFDFWIFKDLTAGEKEDLINNLRKMPSSRAVIAANHLMDWKSLLQDPEFNLFFQSKQICLSFLPQTDELGPFLSPQEVLSELEALPSSYPLLISHFSEKKGSTFYQSLTVQSYIQEKKATRIGLWKALQFLDKIGFHLFILALESLFAYCLEGRSHRIFTFARHFSDFIGHSYRVIRNGIKKVFWYWGFYKIWVLLRYQVWGFLKNHGWIFMRYRFPAFLLFLSYPIRKTYWFCSFQFQKRVLGRLKNHDI